MAVDRVQFQDIVESQFPRYVLEDFPLLPEFIKQYYKSQEYQGGTFDLVQNIDKYIKVDQLFSLKTSTQLNGDLDFTATTIPTSSLTNFAEGFPETNGLIKIDQEIIHYESISNNSFINCTRGFSGITTYVSGNQPDQLTFNQTEATEHTDNSVIQNLNVIFLQEFFGKLKNQIAPGFNDRQFFSDLDQRNFLYNVDSFYKSKGTDQSFKILFRALYGEEVEIIKPSEFLFRPSDADYKVEKDFVVEQVSGDPLELKNLTLFQDSTNSRGSVSDVKPINYGDKQYYQISIDSGYARDISVSGSIFGEFKVNPKTKLLNNVSVGATILDVDSTIGFPDTGNLILKDNVGDVVAIAYTGKSINQFFNVSGVYDTFSSKEDIRLDDYSYAYVGFDTSNQIQVRITSTLKEFKLNQDSYFYNKDDTINIQTLGIERGDERSQNWYSNVKTEWNIEDIDLVDELEKSYFITLFDSHFLRPGYQITLTSNSGLQLPGIVIRSSSANTFLAKLAANIGSIAYVKVENQLLKGNSGKYSTLNNFVANVQNVYQKFNGDVAVASNSLPNYSNIFTDPYDKKITFSGSSDDFETLILTTNQDHGFLNGDAIFYKPGVIKSTTISPDGITVTSEVESKFEDVDANVYYVKRVNSTSIKLARSRADIFSNKFVSLSGTVVDNEFIYYDFYNKKLSPQNIIREVLTANNKSGNYLTEPGYSGILINGVEILNYKSGEGLKYGDLRSLEITNPGEDYDIINPPVLSIVDDYGSGAEGTVSIEGELVGLNLIDRGFGYLDVPTVTITGGSPTEEAIAEVNMTSIQHTLNFNSELSARRIDIGDDTIGFSTFHKLNLADKVFYDAKDGNPIAGLSTNAFYYVELVDTSTIKLHTSEDDARVGINTVNITSFGTGVQAITAVGSRKIVADIFITNPGKGYKNNRRHIPVTGINTASNRFNIPNHGYNSGEIIKYSTTTNGIVGLSTVESYYVNRVDDNNFSLSLVGTGTTDKKYFYDRNILVNISNIGNGSFNYLPIEVKLDGIVGVNTVSGQNFQCKVQPLFRGSIQSVDLTDNGVAYGSSEIINFNRQPNISFNSGKEAQLTPIVSNSRIVDVIVNDGGSQYNSPPNLIITGEGKFAKLTPIIEGGVITSVKIMSGGSGYVSGSTNIQVESAGKYGVAQAVIRNWNINLFERDFDNIGVDDGFVSESIDDNSLEYCHLYAPRPLRSNTYVISGNNETQYGISDLTLSGGIEKTSSYHSPILGWAYDGNPIYGPYGFTDPQGGNISQMISGYELRTNPTNRPPTSLFPLGYFIEDYIFTDRGDLDTHNGRFCVTPDYPNGRYCYFSTLNTFSVDSTGPFKNYRRPIFPYFIGDTFYSKPNITNFGVLSNQSDYNLENGEWFRNTIAYHTNDDNSGYDYVFNSDKEKNQSLDIVSVSKGFVESVGIITGGNFYKVNDRILINDEGTSGTDAQGRVDRVSGIDVNYINSETTSLDNIEFGNIYSLNQFIGFSTQSIPFNTSDVITISGLSTTFNGYSGVTNVRLGIRTDNFVLTLGVGSTSVTGLTTYFYVSGDLNYPTIRENDILGIGTENIRVLNIDNRARRIKVRREYDGISCGLAHTNGSILFEDPRKFRINVGALKTTNSLEINKEYYFYPQEVVGVGTVGVGSTITFSNPGVGITQKFIPTKQIYLPNHGLDVNDRLYYNRQGGTAIGVWNGITTAFKNLDTYDFYYTAPVSRDFIGLSTNKIGMGTESEFVGVGTTSGLLYFTSVPTDDYHSFITDKDNILTGRISRTTVNVATSGTHGLSVADTVYISVKPTDTKIVNVTYDDSSRRIIFDSESITATNTVKNTVAITGHDFIKGDKVLYREGSSPINGLTDDQLYYVYPYDKNSVQFVKEKFQLSKDRPQVVDIASTGNGTLFKINPPLYVKRNNKLKFDLSDPSLSFVVSGVRYSAFELRLYSDSEYTNVYDTSGTKTTFEVTTSGRPGIDVDANLTLLVSDEVPTNLWYKFVPINNDIITNVKKEIFIDTDVNSHQEISVEKTRYDGVYTLSGIGTTTFSYNISSEPDVETYNIENSVTTYETTSLSALGPISRISMLDNGSNYDIIPGIKTVTTSHGGGCILKPQSTSIGNIKGVTFNSQNIGFDYPTDETLRPIANPPEILELESLTSFESIGISSGGRNYLRAPSLVVLDGFTREVVEDLALTYSLGDNKVTILQNSTGMYNVSPEIIPVDNTNGIGIASLAYTPSTKTVRLYLNGTFSDASAFPYDVGSKIFVEKLNVGVNSTAKGYNSENYSYQFFTVTDSDSNLGGGPGAYVDYSLKEYLSDSDVPGNVDLPNSSGRVISVDHFPIFNSTLTTNDFFENEVISYKGKQTGRVESWNPVTEILKVNTSKEYEVGQIVKGLSSDTQAVIKTKIDFDAEITTGAGATITYGWQKNTGFLNDSLQRIPNNEYYQTFSYSIKSRIPYDTWEDPVSALNHTSGYKEFSDLQVISIEDQPLAVAQPVDSDVDTTTDIVGRASLHCFYDFDYVTESNNIINGVPSSDEIFFENRILSDYFQSVGNRVLDIDDFSGEFFSNERPTKYSDIDAFEFNDIYNKIFTFVRDRIFTDERQFSIVSLIQSESIGYMQQYATMETYPELGYFDYFSTADGWNLQFHPVKFANNIYDTSTISISIKDNVTSIGNSNIGSVALVGTNRKTTPNNTLETIVSVSSTFRSVKALVLQEDENGEYASNEFNLIHDGTNVHMVEYGEMQTKPGSYSSTGFGTFGASLAGGFGGSGYTGTPTLSFSGGSPTFAAVGTITTITNGSITGIVLNGQGSGYESAPSVSISGGGTGADITAGLSTTGTIKRFNITSGGSGYTHPPIVTLGGDASGQSATASITSGIVTSIQLDGVTVGTANSTNIYEFGNGTSIAPNGSGTGTLGGFNIGSTHLRFGGASGTRFATLNPVDTTNVDTARVYAVRGNGTNGGETPDIAGTEDLKIQYQTTEVGATPNNSSWIDLGIVIPAVSNGTGTGVLDNYDFNISATPGSISSNTWFRLLQEGNSGSGYDHYGILSVSFIDLQSEYASVPVTLTDNPLETATTTTATATVTLGRRVTSLSLSGNNIVLNYTPNVGTAVTTNTSIVAISDSATGISSLTFQESRLNSGFKNIASSGSPSANTILQFEEPYSTGYYIVSVKDTTNSQYEMFEVCVIASESNHGFVEFANIRTGNSIGQIGFTTTGKYRNLTYTPNASTAVQVRTFGIEQKIYDADVSAPINLNLNNVNITSDKGLYRGTKLDLRTAFDLKHDGLPIFERQFAGDTSTTFDFDNNTLFLKEHFFVTGENVTYSYAGNGTEQAIGIALTSVSGIGVTNKLPKNLFVVKIGDGSVRFAESAEKALRLNPEVLQFTSVGIGTSHNITAKKQNAKSLIAVDNMIQAPLSKTKIVTSLNDNIIFDSIFSTSGITSIAAADLIKINNEVMRVVSVGVGGAGNLTVQRGQLGTNLEPHGIGSTITKMSGTYNIVGSTVNFVSPPYGAIPLSTTSSAPSERDYTGLTTHSTFQGRTFMRTAPVNTDRETYFANHVFDDVSNNFTGLRSEFRLTSEGQNTTGFSTDNAIILINNIFQEPQGVQATQGTYDLSETASGISSIRFEESGAAYGYDPNRSNLPIGGFIVSIGSTEGGGYQPLIGAGGTVTVSAAGTITSVSIGNSGSGYRSGLGTVFVGVQTSSIGTPNIQIIGKATVSGGNVTGVTVTNPGSGYTSTNLPKLVIDDPASYTNIPLIYSGSSVQGIGQSATIDIQVGSGGSVIDYQLKQEGFAYGNDEILTVPVGGATGIPTSGSFSEFQITVDEIYQDDFNGFSIGQLQVLDNFDSQFDGLSRSFRLSVNDVALSIQSAPGSPIEVDKTLLIFINDVLQQPEVAYTFTGGGTVQFVEPPEPGDSSKVLFYKGSGDVDVVFTDVLETIKTGDTLDINNNPEQGQGTSLDEDVRTVVGINTIDSVQTTTYSGPGVTNDTTLSRPLTWCKQQVDKIINGQEIGKDRIEYEPLIYPTSYLIQPISLASTIAYVDSVRPLFDTYTESGDRDFQNKIKILSQDTLVSASATATVSGLGTVSINITSVGSGYTIAPTLSISNPFDGTRATGTLSLSSGSVGVVTITNPGTGYTNINPPSVLISEPTIVREEIGVDDYSGDYGVLVGFGLSTVSGGNEIILDFYIPTDSFMRDSEYVGTGITVSGIGTGDYFSVFNSNIETTETVDSKRIDRTPIGITTSFIDCVYQVKSTYTLEKNVIGIGTTTVRRVFVNVGNISTESFSSSLITFDSSSYTLDTRTFTVYAGGISSASNMGRFSWGKIQFEGRTSPQEFSFYGNNGIIGISSSGLLSRFEPLKYRDYTS